ncbi:hypothetical protein [Spiroplasma phoeniceum]|uniref:Uncharacterized protein n=1 Tax=Spiroplasma phoeniceum P40 TaxID=1276259 RepID=A0A345DSF3_9MOLU|nr:hypothetical protein [Spiroplasma phoeniceum]AXF97144.1 hypothetical protein SDAV_002211 [Spiroplasma phoeniceum P40]
MTITEWIKYEKLEKENQVLKNQIAEKDKEIEKLKQVQLYKEDFVIYSFGCEECNLTYSCKNKCKLFWTLKDNLKYDKLPSKEDKTCI